MGDKPQPRMRWYNPNLQAYEWREIPIDDEGALALLEGSEPSTQIYRYWRELGASVVASLIRAGEERLPEA